MKLKVTQVQTIELDMAAERERINRCEFSDDQRERLLKVCDLMEEGKFLECVRFVSNWGRCPKEECPETEFLSIPIGDALQAICRGCKVEIAEPEKPIPKCGFHGGVPFGFVRMDCEYGEDGNCIHCGEGIPF